MVVHRRKKSAKKKGDMYRMGKRRRGSGNRGGFGRAGYGKRAGQKASQRIKLYGRLKSKGFTSLKGKKLDTVNLSDLNIYDKEVELKNTKVLGKGQLTKKLQVKATSFSKMAKEKIEHTGGVCIEI